MTHIGLDKVHALLSDVGAFSPNGASFVPAAGLHRVGTRPRGGSELLFRRRLALVEAIADSNDDICWLIPRGATTATFGDGTTEALLELSDPNRSQPHRWRVVRGRFDRFDLSFATRVLPGLAALWLTVPARALAARLGARHIDIWGPAGEAEFLDRLAASPPEPANDHPTPRQLEKGATIPAEERDAWAAATGRVAPDLVWVDLMGHGAGELWLNAGDGPVRVARASCYRTDDHSGAEDRGFVAELLALPDGEWLVRIEHVHELHYGPTTSRHEVFISEGSGARFVAHEGAAPEGAVRVGQLVQR
ncbi:MAG: hypothetical protein JJ863_24285 [Deltaproteobacteria bacterium]|nr:hypothetical protein [Deltaproteobacteria bacterium]